MQTTTETVEIPASVAASLDDKTAGDLFRSLARHGASQPARALMLSRPSPAQKGAIFETALAMRWDPNFREAETVAQACVESAAEIARDDKAFFTQAMHVLRSSRYIRKQDFSTFARALGERRLMGTLEGWAKAGAFIEGMSERPFWICACEALPGLLARCLRRSMEKDPESWTKWLAFLASKASENLLEQAREEMLRQGRDFEGMLRRPMPSQSWLDPDGLDAFGLALVRDNREGAAWIAKASPKIDPLERLRLARQAFENQGLGDEFPRQAEALGRAIAESIALEGAAAPASPRPASRTL